MRVFLDDVREPYHVGYGSGWVIVRSASDAIAILSTGKVTEISLDHDLGEVPTGYDVINWMEATGIWPDLIYIHSANPVGRDNMKRAIEANGRKVSK